MPKMVILQLFSTIQCMSVLERLMSLFSTFSGHCDLRVEAKKPCFNFTLDIVLIGWLCFKGLSHSLIPLSAKSVD